MRVIGTLHCMLTSKPGLDFALAALPEGDVGSLGHDRVQGVLGTAAALRQDPVLAALDGVRALGARATLVRAVICMRMYLSVAEC